MSKAVARAVAGALLFAASAAPAAVWDTHPSLLCQGVKTISCDIETLRCADQGTNALWQIDFRAGTLIYFGGEIRERIVGRNVESYDGKVLGESVFLSSGRVMHFFKLERDLLGNFIPAVVSGAYFPQSGGFSTFRCAER